MNDYFFDCNNCSTRCDGISKGVYNFVSDVEYSEQKENFLIDLINNVDGFFAKKCEEPGFLHSQHCLIYQGVVLLLYLLNYHQNHTISHRHEFDFAAYNYLL